MPELMASRFAPSSSGNHRSERSRPSDLLPLISERIDDVPVFAAQLEHRG
jgi:hypothetical protein